jgi:hypothetical protein
VVGNATNRALISARGQAVPAGTSDLAIARLTVGGRVEQTDILAGYTIDGDPVNGDAQIGAVKVGTDWITSNLVAGIMTASYFGSNDDMVIPGSSAVRSSKIASIAVGGQVLGTPDSVNPDDHYGFEAESIGSLRVGGTAIPLKAGPHDDDLFVGSTGDVRVRELQ